MSIYQVTIRYDGFPGSPGFNTLYFVGEGEANDESILTNASAAHNEVTSFMTGYSGDTDGMPALVDWSVESEVIARNPSDGQGLALYAVGASSGSGTPAGELLPSANGLVATWRSETFGPRGRGRSFMPVGTENQSIGGLPSGPAVGALVTHGEAFIAAAEANALVNFVVWHRPTPALPSSGSVAVVTQISVRSQWGILRSRRD